MNKVKQNTLSAFHSLTSCLRRKKIFLSHTLLYCFFSTTVFANPTGGQIAEGSGTITTPNSKKVVIQQSTDKMIIDWQSFNIGANEKTQFNQPSTSSIVLNRINPANGASAIAGQLSANGQVWLINPAGIAFAQGAKVDAAGLLATTADITNANFMNGNYQFTRSAQWNGVITNNGTITISDQGIAALVAPNVANNGVIKARLGKVALAAANEFTLDFYGDQLIVFGVNSGVSKSANKNIVSNDGEITANGGTVLLTAKAASNVLDTMISMKGIITAKKASTKDGTIILSGSDTVSINVTGKLATSKKGTIRIEHQLVVPPPAPTPPPVEVTPPPAVEISPTPVVEITPPPVIDVTPPPIVEVPSTPIAEVTPPAIVEVTPTQVAEVAPLPIIEIPSAPTVAETPILPPLLINNNQPIATAPTLSLSEPITLPAPLANFSSATLLSAHESESRNLAYLTSNTIINQLASIGLRSTTFNSTNIFVRNNNASNAVNNNPMQINTQSNPLSVTPNQNARFDAVGNDNAVTTPIAENSPQSINDNNNQAGNETAKKEKQST